MRGRCYGAVAVSVIPPERHLFSYRYRARCWLLKLERIVRRHKFGRCQRLRPIPQWLDACAFH